MRLIDADKLIDDYNDSDGTISDLMELILDAGEIKVGHIVKCKDCKYRKKLEGCFLDGTPIYYCIVYDGLINPQKDDFCSYVQNKETED